MKILSTFIKANAIKWRMVLSYGWEGGGVGGGGDGGKEKRKGGIRYPK